MTQILAMRSKFLLIGFLLIYVTINAQVTNEGYPKSWEINSANKKKVMPEIMKTFDIEKLQKEDEVNEINKSGAWRFGYELEVNLGLENIFDN